MLDNDEEKIKRACFQANEAVKSVATVSPASKNKVLYDVAKELLKKKEVIIEHNKQDLADARKDKNLSKAFIDKLVLDEHAIAKMATACESVANQEDCVGEISDLLVRPNGLQVGKMRVPIGVVGVIYESRPYVTIDAASICLKSGNAAILRGCTKAARSNKVLAEIFQEKIVGAGIPSSAVQFLDVTDKGAIDGLLKQHQYIDVLIPRGGKKFIRQVMANTRIPILGHLDGNCHIFIDETADLATAMRLVVNSKTQRPSICNAAEKLLLARGIAEVYLPVIANELRSCGVELLGCERTTKIMPDIKPAIEEDWFEEFLDLKMAIKIVDGIDDALAHINKYGSRHTDAIVTKDYGNALNFLKGANSATVLVNASTRFSDGGEFGMCSEMGISTCKIHARGPIGTKELTIQKFIVFGDGHIRETR